jgi:hypothetical protein
LICQTLHKKSIFRFISRIEQNTQVYSVNVLGEEDGMLNLLIEFNNNDTILVENVKPNLKKKQQRMIIHSCNNYVPFVYMQSHAQKILVRIGLLSLIGELNDNGASLYSLEDIIQKNALIFDYMENIPVINSEMYNEMKIEAMSNSKELNNDYETVIIKEKDACYQICNQRLSKNQWGEGVNGNVIFKDN